MRVSKLLDQRKDTIQKAINKSESAKLRALHALVPMCLACLTCSRGNVSYVVM